MIDLAIDDGDNMRKGVTGIDNYHSSGKGQVVFAFRVKQIAVGYHSSG